MGFCTSLLCYYSLAYFFYINNFYELLKKIHKRLFFTFLTVGSLTQDYFPHCTKAHSAVNLCKDVQLVG